MMLTSCQNLQRDTKVELQNIPPHDADFLSKLTESYKSGTQNTSPHDADFLLKLLQRVTKVELLVGLTGQLLLRVSLSDIFAQRISQ